MHVEIQNRPISPPYEGCPEVPYPPAPSTPFIPEILYPVILKTMEGDLKIGTVGRYPTEIGDRRWAWYCLLGNMQHYKRGRSSATDAVWALLKHATEYDPHSGSARIPMRDNTP